MILGEPLAKLIRSRRDDPCVERHRISHRRRNAIRYSHVGREPRLRRGFAEYIRRARSQRRRRGGLNRASPRRVLFRLAPVRGRAPARPGAKTYGTALLISWISRNIKIHPVLSGKTQRPTMRARAAAMGRAGQRGDLTSDIQESILFVQRVTRVKLRC